MQHCVTHYEQTFKKVLAPRSAKERLVDTNMRSDSSYAPFCHKCLGRSQMTRVSRSFARCGRCGAFHGVPAVMTPPVEPPEINTHVRLFDLVRYMRSELHQEELITDEEYTWLCSGAGLAKGAGSPSPRRLEDYDRMRQRIKKLEDGLHSVAAHDGPGFVYGTCTKIAEKALEKENESHG